MEKKLSKKSATNKSITKKDSKKARRIESEKNDSGVTLVQKGCK